MQRNSIMKTDSKTLFTVLTKPPTFRTEFECQQFVSWFKNKTVLFRTLKSGKRINISMLISLRIKLVLGTANNACTNIK